MSARDQAVAALIHDVAHDAVYAALGTGPMGPWVDCHYVDRSGEPTVTIGSGGEGMKITRRVRPTDGR